MTLALLRKEMVLSAHILSYAFILFGTMTLLPGYPILCGAFFVTLGLFQSYQASREANDVTFSVLLPVAKKDVVKGKFLFALLIEGCALALMAALTLLRMTALSDAAVYRSNALMNANPFFIGAALLIFGTFNLIFISGFFKTAYKFGWPFVIYIGVCFAIIGICETLHHFPGLSALNAFGFECLGSQMLLLAAGAGCFALLTLAAYRRACAAFERIDL